MGVENAGMAEHLDLTTSSAGSAPQPGVGTDPPVPVERSGKPPGANDYGEQDENGVDLSLLRYMLQLSPLERLQWMERAARDTQLLNEYGRPLREASFADRR
jgi:hypothetical protein